MKQRHDDPGTCVFGQTFRQGKVTVMFWRTLVFVQINHPALLGHKPYQPSIVRQRIGGAGQVPGCSHRIAAGFTLIQDPCGTLNHLRQRNQRTLNQRNMRWRVGFGQRIGDAQPLLPIIVLRPEKMFIEKYFAAGAQLAGKHQHQQQHQRAEQKYCLPHRPKFATRRANVVTHRGHGE